VKTNRIICLGLFLLTLWVYLPALRHDFVVYDDENYVRANPHVVQGLTSDNIRWAFTTGYQSNWHPLTWLSHMVDCQFFGLQPWGHHLTNLLFHALNTTLVFLVLRTMTGLRPDKSVGATAPQAGAIGRSLFVALLFGLHPLHVESVAWIAERKDVLSTCFGLLTLLAYARYAQCVTSDGWPAPAVSRFTFHVSRFYWLALFLFALALMSKPMLVTLPCVLLLLDYWPLDRWRRESFWKLAVEKVPFFLFAAALSAITVMDQKGGGALRAMADASLIYRGENALVSYGRYLGKLFYPVNLSFYPNSEGWEMHTVLLAGLLLCGLTAFAYSRRRQQPWLLVGWLWFVGTLVPVIGLIQGGWHAMADRYMYIPSIGLFIIVAWGVHEWTRHWRYQAVTLAAIGIVVVLVSTALTRRQLACWTNSETLFRHAIAVTENNYEAHQYLGFVLKREGRFDEAIAEFNEVLEIAPDIVAAHTCLGDALVLSGQKEEGVKELETAIRLDPTYADAHCFLANALSMQNREAEAIRQYEEAIRLNPNFPAAHNNLGTILWKQGRLPEARDHFSEAVRLRPGDAKFRDNLDRVLAEMGSSGVEKPVTHKSPPGK
jgi:tetratricopeptide (TPR) repeat protein